MSVPYLCSSFAVLRPEPVHIIVTERESRREHFLTKLWNVPCVRFVATYHQNESFTDFNPSSALPNVVFTQGQRGAPGDDGFDGV